jgi:hypothetical protein
LTLASTGTHSRSGRARLWAEGFRNAAQAGSFRSSLLTAARKGEAFRLRTGRPMSWERDESARSWYALTLGYAAAKWPYAAPNHRKSIAEALTDATEAMVTSDEPPCPSDDIRRALRTWAFSDRIRGSTEPPTTWRPSCAGCKPPPCQ